jgi:hypothetical protein
MTPPHIPALRNLALPALWLALGAACLNAQSSTTGALSGAVAAPAGIVAGAAVTLVNSATNQTLRAVTDAKGAYRFAMLAPGTYQVQFAAPGFKTARMPSMTVNVSEDPTLDATLEPGSGDEEVVCACRVSLTGSSSGTLVDRKTITSVPLNTRNFTQVLSMSSGSAADVNNAGTLGRGNQAVNVNGSTTAGSYTLDGAYAASTVPNPDTISEFKIQTSQYDAGYGAQVPNTNLITRSGEKQPHGTAWEFVRNDVFNANAFFRNTTGQEKPNLKQNQFGLALGGPLIANRWFAFGSYQGTRQVNGLDPTSFATVILPPLTADRSAATVAAQLCPANHPGDARFLSFAGGRQLDCANRSTSATAPINPVALRILQAKNADGTFVLPVPQTTVPSGSNAGMGFSSFSLPSTYDEDQLMANSDYVLSPKHTLAWRGFFSKLNQLRSLGAPGNASLTPAIPGDGAPQALQARDSVMSLKLGSVPATGFVNEARIMYTRSRQQAHGVGFPAASDFGITPINSLLPYPPEITILGSMGIFRFFGNGANDFYTLTNVTSLADNLSRARGRHTIRVGAFAQAQHTSRLDTGAARGKVTFQSFEDFLLGLNAADNQSPSGRSNVQSVSASAGVGPAGEVQYEYRRYYGALFFMDDIKVSPRLTVNAGLRWEYIAPAFDTEGTMSNVWPSLLQGVPPVTGTLAGYVLPANYNAALINPYTGKAFGAPPAGVTNSEHSSFYRNRAPLDSFAPRFGFAWQPFGAGGRIAIRGGYGWFYQTPTLTANAGNAPLFTAPPFAQGFAISDSTNGQSTLARPFPDVTLGFIPRTPTSRLADRIAGPEFQVPRLQQWNFSVQTKLVKTLTFDIGYVGSYGDRLLIGLGINQPLLATSSKPVNCGYTGVATECIATNTALNARLRVPYMGETPSALMASRYLGESAYHSMQATLRKQLSAGLTFQVAYTFSKSMSNTSIYNDLNNLYQNWAKSGFDRNHRVITNFGYDFPHRAAHGAAARLVNGWSISGIMIVQSGIPLTLSDPAGGGVYGRASTSTVTLCPGATAASLATSGGTAARLNQWVDSTGLCAATAIGDDGSTGYGNAGQSILAGPPQINTDFSLGKRTLVGGLREDGELALRVEFYNALNHPQFANPGASLNTANFGVITQTAVAPRLIQFALKYLF